MLGQLPWVLRKKNGGQAGAQRLGKGLALCHPSWSQPWNQQADKSCFLHPSRASGTNSSPEPAASISSCEQNLDPCGLLPSKEDSLHRQGPNWGKGTSLLLQFPKLARTPINQQGSP